MIQDHYDQTVRQQKLLIRQACEQHGFHHLDDVNWYRLWEELKGAMHWDDLAVTQQIHIKQAAGQARDEIKQEGLFPAGWNVGTVSASI